MIGRAWLAGGVALAAACAPSEHHGKGATAAPRADAAADAAAAGGDSTMTTTTCESARQAVASRRFIGWRGLPAGCDPSALVGVGFDDTWGMRKLGDRFQPARMRLLEWPGYYRPLVSVRDGAVVMIDGTNPELDGGWAALAADLGAPEATRDFVHGTTPMGGGERVYASRGITVFVNPDNDFVVHVAVYPPTTVADYLERLRPSLGKVMPGR
ncbi:MAG: hypothetical protein JNK64_12880 [Myxococcales bacterium]|nr:hypothetical protein [Myxococcales bacterium]